MHNDFTYYNWHMNSPVSNPNSRRETEIEYIFRVAREAAAAEKAEKRRLQKARFMAALRTVFSRAGFSRTVNQNSLFGH